MRRLIPALSLVLVALVAGCGTGPGAEWADPATPAADAVAVIQQAMQRSLASTLTIEATVKLGGISIKLRGKADPKTNAMQVSGNAPDPMEARVVGDAAYLKMDALKGDKPWTKIDMTRLRPTSTLRQSFDLKTQTGIVGGVVSAEKIGDGRYRGTADLDKAAEAAGANATMRNSMESGARLAKDPKAVRFEATVDGEGRLTALSYTIATNDMGDAVTDVRMSGFGEPVRVTAPPAGDVEEADDEMYKVL
jgi:hypothetical protein